MPATVLIKDIVDALEMQFDEHLSFLDVETGQVEPVSRELLGLAEEMDAGDEEEPESADLQDEEWEIAKRIVSSDRFVGLPTEFDVHEWSIMEARLFREVGQDSGRSVIRYSRRRGLSALQGHRSALRD